MSTYKRSTWIMIKALMIAPFIPFGVGMVLLWVIHWFEFDWLFYPACVITLLSFIFMVYNAIWGSNIRFEITEDGKCNYYKKNKLRKSYDLTVCELSYFDGGTEDLRLLITDESGEEETLECAPIGKKQFDVMYKQMKSFSKVEPERL